MSSYPPILSQCAPISLIKVHEASLLIAEGPSLLLQERKQGLLSRYQLFPNHFTITGLEVIHDTAIVWAGTHVLFVKIKSKTLTPLKIRTEDTHPHNCGKQITLDYLPIASKYLQGNNRVALLANFNCVVLYKLIERGEEEEEEDGNGKWISWREVGRWGCDAANLYCGTLHGDTLEELRIFSGTSFKGILVWRIEEEEALGIITHRLHGHKGIPFSLDYHEARGRGLLLSASDDRTVMVWLLDGLQGEFKISRVLRDHEARIWKASWVEQGDSLFIISVGEDSTVVCSSFEDENFKKSWKAHDGAPTYSCAWDSINDLLYTSAHDGSVHKWKHFSSLQDPSHIPYDVVELHPWTQHLVQRDPSLGKSLGNEDYPRNVCVWDAEHLIALMDSGRIIAHNYNDKVQSTIFWDQTLAGYGVLAASRQNTMLAVGALKGEFFLLRTRLHESFGGKPGLKFRFQGELAFPFKFPRKVINIHWLTDDDARNLCLIVTLDTAYLFRFYYPNQCSSSSSGRSMVGECLEKFSGGWSLERPALPAALLLEDERHLIIGDDVGSIHVFKVKEFAGTGADCIVCSASTPPTEPCFTLEKVHKEGVTSLVERKCGDKIMITSGGRYGGLRSYLFQPLEHPMLLQTQEFRLPFEWIAKISLIRGDMLIGGFHKGNYVIYSWKGKRVLTEIHRVGGGHRRWDFKYQETHASLAFLRDGELFFTQTSIQEAQNIVVKPGLHSKTVNCGVFLEEDEEGVLLALGSEDGSLRIIKYNTTLNSFTLIHRINFHSSSVRSISCIRILDKKRREEQFLVFSAGGKSTVYATLLGISADPTIAMVGKISLINSNTKSRRSSKSEIDLRVMDLSILEEEEEGVILCACACSDGAIRILSYSKMERKLSSSSFSLLEGNGHSLMRVNLLKSDALEGTGQKHLYAFAVTSNGFLLSWRCSSSSNVQSFQFYPIPHPIQLRSCAILCMELFEWVDRRVYLVIGGDDCSISCWALSLGVVMEGTLLWEENQVQRGPVVGLHIDKPCDNSHSFNYSLNILSVSNDQVVCRWGKDGALLGSTFGVGCTDLQGFICCDKLIACYGDGVGWIVAPTIKDTSTKLN